MSKVDQLRTAPRALPLPIRQPAGALSIEQRARTVEQRLLRCDAAWLEQYRLQYTMAWIYHDSALDGTVYAADELKCALAGQAPIDSAIQEQHDGIRHHAEAIWFVQDYGLKRHAPLTVDVLRKLFCTLHPEEGPVMGVQYRTENPQHRLYLHEYPDADLIEHMVQQIVQRANHDTPSVRSAARLHHDLLRLYPFSYDSGKVSRLMGNILLIRAGLPVSVIHAADRGRYYEAVMGEGYRLLHMVQESVEGSLASTERALDHREHHMRSF